MDSAKGDDPASVDLMLLSSAKKLATESPSRVALRFGGVGRELAVLEDT